MEPSPLLLWPLIGLLYQSRMIDGDDCGAISRVNEWQGKQKYLGKTCPSAALSTTDPTWLDLGSNTGCHGGKPASNCLSYVMAYINITTIVYTPNITVWQKEVSKSTINIKCLYCIIYIYIYICSYTKIGCPVIEVSSFYQTQQSRFLPPLHLRMDVGPVSKTLCCLEYRIMGKVKEHNNA
jgi:hypothetical protein